MHGLGRGTAFRVIGVLVAAVLAAPTAVPVALAAGGPTGLTPDTGTATADTPVFGWNPVAGATSYHVQLATGGSWADPLVDVHTVNRWLSLGQRLAAGAYEWRVAAVLETGTVTTWAVASLTITGGLTTPDLVEGTVDGAWPTSPRVLEWTAVPGAAGYAVRVTTGPLDSLDDDPDGFQVGGTRWVVPPAVNAGALVPTTLWQVRAHGLGGTAPSAWSAVGQLSSSWPAAPVQTTPDGAHATWLTVDWDPLAGATAYTVEIEPLDGQGPAFAVRSAASRLRVRPADHTLTGDDRYGAFRWRVRGIAKLGHHDPFPSGWSPWRTIHIDRLPAPAMFAPAHGSTQPDVPRFAWAPVPGATEYEMQLSADPSFTGEVITVFSNDTAIEAGQAAAWGAVSSVPTLLDGTTYHWRVRGQTDVVDAHTVSAWSAVRAFTVDRPSIAQHAPADGASVTVPTLAWDGSRAFRFEVTIKNAADEVVASGQTVAGRWTPPARLDPADGPFAWQVAAVTPMAPYLTLATSPWRSFTLTPLVATAVEPVIADPSAGELGFTMSWTPVGGADHYDIVASWPDSDGTLPLNGQDPLHYPSFTYPGGGQVSSESVQWRVVAYAADGTEIVRGPRRAVAVQKPPAPEVLAPASCTTEACGTPTSPTFTWAPVEGASHYVLSTADVSPSVGMVGPVSELVTGTAARIRHVHPYAHDGAFTWSVMACAGETCGPLSEPRMYRWTRVIPELTGPADGAVVEDEVVLGSAGGTPPTAPPGVEPAWTYQDPKYMLPETTHVATGEAFSLDWGFEISLGIPRRTFTLVSSAPSIVGPVDGATVDGAPLLQWAPVPGAEAYGIEIHAGATGPLVINDIAHRAVAAATSYAPPSTLAPGTYRWRVRRVGYSPFYPEGTGGGPWSAAQSFTVPGAAPPVPLGPAAGATAHASNLLFSWTPVAGASGYRVELSRDGSFGVLGHAATTASTGWAPTTALSGGSWWWRVAALGAEDTPISVSEGRALVVDAPLLTPLRNAVVVEEGRAFAHWHDVNVAFPIAAQLGARRVRLSNDGVTWRTFTWHPEPFRWDVAPGAQDGVGTTTAATALYTVHGQWERPDGTWSPVATDTVFFDADRPSATVTLDGGAATTSDREVLLAISVDDDDGAGPARVCDDAVCVHVAPNTGPVPWLLPAGEAGPRQVCVEPYDVHGTSGTPTCATITLAGTAPPSVAAGHLGLKYSGMIAPSHWYAGYLLSVTAEYGTGRSPAPTDTCSWELRWGDHPALRDGAANGSGGGIATTGTAAEGFCGGWTFRVPAVAAGMATMSLTVRDAAGAVRLATPTAWAQRPRFSIIDPGNAQPEVTDSSLPIATLAVEGGALPGEQLTVSATPRGFTPTSRSLVARSPTGATATAADGSSLTLTTPEQGRWAVRWTGQRGSAIVAAYLDPSATMLDAVAPRSSVPMTRARTGVALGSSVLARVSWTGSDVGTGVARYDLQVSRSGGAWSMVATPSATATSADVTLALSGSYRYRARAVDKAGNPGAWMTGPLLRATTISDSSVSVSGTWRRAYASSYLGGSTRYATARGASASWRFTGSGIAWVAATGPTRGSATVYVDGVKAATVSLWSSTARTRRVVFSTSWAVNGTHTIKIVVAGTSGRPRVDLDGFVLIR